MTHNLARCEPHFSGAMAHLREDFRTVTGSELEAIRGDISAVVMSFEDSFHQYRTGTLDIMVWQTDKAMLRNFITMPMARVEGSYLREFLTGSYRDYLDTLLCEVNADIGKDGRYDDWLKIYEKELAA